MAALVFCASNYSGGYSPLLQVGTDPRAAARARIAAPVRISKVDRLQKKTGKGGGGRDDVWKAPIAAYTGCGVNVARGGKQTSIVPSPSSWSFVSLLP
jgi:hypothetical protein